MEAQCSLSFSGFFDIGNPCISNSSPERVRRILSVGLGIDGEYRFGRDRNFVEGGGDTNSSPSSTMGVVF